MNFNKCLNLISFEEILKISGSDKSSLHHNFALFYDEQLSRIPYPNAILEIGVLKGYSLIGWSIKYPCSEIYGWDYIFKSSISNLTDKQNLRTTTKLPYNKEDMKISEYLKVNRFHLDYADQLLKQTMFDAIDRIHIISNQENEKEETDNLIEENEQNEQNQNNMFDIIIDDGGHSMLMQQNTLSVLWPHVNPCGVFIMEDLQTSFIDEFIDVLPTTYDLLSDTSTSNDESSGGLLSDYVDMIKIRSEASSIEIFKPNNQHITSVIHKKCVL